MTLPSNLENQNNSVVMNSIWYMFIKEIDICPLWPCPLTLKIKIIQSSWAAYDTCAKFDKNMVNSLIAIQDWFNMSTVTLIFYDAVSVS